MNEKRNPARPGSALERERQQIRRGYRPSAREVFQIATDLRRMGVQIVTEEEES